ncbi:MAG: helix-turn-helix transcriptional regulator [Oscillospiraceae bacterium]|nr:helix-turn-helix transcriptional regulator [Oscillospiraceae bacterium]
MSDGKGSELTEELMEIREKIGMGISDTRVELDLTQEELGSKINLDKSAISRIEAGAQGIDIEKVVYLSKKLNVRVEYLLGMDTVFDEETHALNTIMSLFDGITTSKKFARDDKTMYFPEKAVFCKQGDYLVVTGKKRLFDLLNELAKTSGELSSQKNELSKKEYEGKCKEAYQQLRKYYRETTKAARKCNFQSGDDEVCSYLFVSKEQLERYIDEKVAAEIENRKALEIIDEPLEDE